MEIGLFQLENLFLSRTQFHFFDLRHSSAPIEPKLETLLAPAKRVLSGEPIHEHLSALHADKAFPVVLICEDGIASELVAQKLESLGYQNVYKVTGGLAGLLSEL